ncbi:Uu.00g062560.m01.CDS01 [Anthostomella pinea]|uniref:Uu.00g062560.m01.CDS01 n=1 Tax=Anthostomella pinea TaxID=933095 RepID=A0AAI8VMM1_9PEZI|nr:Uu.00g062560.m01.CDS01 [Anthostomella pinea]
MDSQTNPTYSEEDYRISVDDVMYMVRINAAIMDARHNSKGDIPRCVTKLSPSPDPTQKMSKRSTEPCQPDLKGGWRC